MRDTTLAYVKRLLKVFGREKKDGYLVKFKYGCFIFDLSL